MGLGGLQHPRHPEERGRERRQQVDLRGVRLEQEEVLQAAAGREEQSVGPDQEVIGDADGLDFLFFRQPSCRSVLRAKPDARPALTVISARGAASRLYLYVSRVAQLWGRAASPIRAY